MDGPGLSALSWREEMDLLGGQELKARTWASRMRWVQGVGLSDWSEGGEMKLERQVNQIKEELVDPAECPVIQIFPKNQARSHRSRGSDMVLEAWILWRSSILS